MTAAIVNSAGYGVFSLPVIDMPEKLEDTMLEPAAQPDLAHIDVRYVANLARIAVSDAEVERYQQELDAIVEYVKLLDQVDVNGIEPTAHASGRTNVLRPDIVGTSLERDVFLANCPCTDDDQYLRVPVVIEDEQEGV